VSVYELFERPSYRIVSNNFITDIINLDQRLRIYQIVSVLATSVANENSSNRY